MSDEVMQDLDRMVRVGFSTAAQLGEQLRRRAADADRRQRDAAVDEQRAAAERARTFREQARSHYTKVGWADWQDQATLAEWASAYQVAHQMRAQDPVAAAAHDRIEAEVRRRYHVDIREALQLHLQQVAEDQRIHAEREQDLTVDQTPGAVDEATSSETTVAHEPRAGEDEHAAATSETAGPDLDPAAGPFAESASADVTAQDTAPDPAVVIPGEVITDAELAEARAAAQTAARGFDQTGRAAVRQHRTTLFRRRREGSARRDIHTITTARRRGR